MAVVVDASVAVKWGIAEGDTPAALALWDAWERRQELLLAPPIFRAEVTNVLYKALTAGVVSASEGGRLVDLILSAVAIAEPAGTYRRAFHIAREFRLPSTYDALYVALAEHQGCELWTADRRLVRAVQRHMPFVRSLDDAPEAEASARGLTRRIT